ncbi:hypothetical protein M427DRAFT_377830 [Gonapodya prolifera JEL478]|uniref:G-protein coupled receptors family 1 profile domain-containing protein n=1 Tax=Gonapodya prolifera (strain JEL478) TaxID=1344416 RepID=A0A139AV04_GONPJ|nr:hypothetical protein M427DRAFT_377830 [Gonapodya prolifera JEL478]|eukprot:KXS20537.1 hypothetical protein M427DRAFT_377830 [Gonapodya prolifera JEL478]
MPNQQTCDVTAVMTLAAAIVAIWTMALIAVERFSVICWRTSTGQFRGAYIAGAIFGWFWTFAVGGTSAGLRHMALDTFPDECTANFSSRDIVQQSLFGISGCAFAFLGTSTIVTCYAAIKHKVIQVRREANAVRARRPTMPERDSSNSSIPAAFNGARRGTMRTVMTVMTVGSTVSAARKDWELGL